MIAFAALLALLVYLPIGYAATLEERREREVMYAFLPHQTNLSAIGRYVRGKRR